MNLLKLNNKRAQEGLSDVMKWIMYLAILVVATLAFRSIIIGARG